MKAEVDKLDINKLTNVPTSLNNLKAKLVIGLVTTTVSNTKTSKVGNKILDNSKYITTQWFNKLTVETFAARLKQADLVNKTHFDNKLTSFNRRITSNKTKYLEVQKKLNSLITKYYNFFLARICFACNDGSQNVFSYQSRLDALELKNGKCSD